MILIIVFLGRATSRTIEHPHTNQDPTLKGSFKGGYRVYITVYRGISLGFPKIGGCFLEVPIIRIVKISGFRLGPPYLGKLAYLGASYGSWDGGLGFSPKP